ncbi:MAG: MBL fold metallo-hydrolase [Proteobacteria bacterium SG_bin7]|nr:MAG: MBL fold metallo-hydrolase [Proteobacteria bacterium SG_bin7]
MQDPKTLQSLALTIGEYEVHSIPTGLFGLDGGAMFGTVPKTLWHKTNPADEHNRIDLEARALLLKSKERNILIDNGVGRDFVAKYGEKVGKKFAEIYKVSSNGADLISSLSRHGIKVNDITDVVLSHLHFDHAGGSTCVRDGKLVATFPNATYWVQKRNLEVAIKPNVRERASYLPANFAPLIETGKLKTLEGESSDVFPNIKMYISHGHTEGLQVIVISDDKNGIVYCADLIPTSSHIRLPYVMGYDLEPLKVIEEKRKLLTEVEKKKWYLFFEHDPFVEAAHVEFRDGDFHYKEGFILQ